MAMRKAISPVIATVILIAITIVIGAAVGGWLLGLWGGFGDVEAIRIYPDAQLKIFEERKNQSSVVISANLTLTLKNEGTRDAIIRKITVEGVGECSKNIVLVRTTPTPASMSFSLKAGQTESIRCTMSNVGNKVTAGGSYLVKVMTESGGVYQITVTARSG